MTAVLCVDVGSTFTKGVLVDAADGALLAYGSHPTTIGSDVLDGVHAVRAELERRAGRPAAELLACSSAGGGLRIAVIGYERLVTAEAGYRVALSAGGRVVHVHAGRLDAAGLAEVRQARPDLLLLVGGTDGGNADILLHNAARLAAARMALPVVLAGNAAAAEPARQELERRGARGRVTVTANVLPRIGALEPQPAREAIREAFLRHVIGGKHLSRGPAFRRMVRGATPDVVLSGVEALAGADTPDAAEVLVVDVGGATTDVYSVLIPHGSAAVAARREVVTPLWRARTVEADLGLRWNAPGILAAAQAERLIEPDRAERLRPVVERLAAEPGFVPGPSDPAAEQDAELAGLAVTVAVRRHGRPAGPGGSARPLRDVSLVVGSGGVLRHAPAAAQARILAPLLTDHGGGWQVPERARVAVDARYTLFAAGLLAPQDPALAARLVRSALVPLQQP